MVRTNIVVGRFFQIIGLLFIALGIAGLAGLELDEALAGTATSVATALITMLEDIIEEAVRGGGASQPQVPSSGVVTHPQREPTALPSYPPSGPEGEVAAGRPQTRPLPESGEPGYVEPETHQAPEGMESEQSMARLQPGTLCFFTGPPKIHYSKNSYTPTHTSNTTRGRSYWQ